MINEATQILEATKAISLEEMDSVGLMNRHDSKFIFSSDLLLPLLYELKYDHRILRIDDRHIHTYENAYFDTPEYQFFRDHHRGKANRFKVRQRRYTQSGLTFCEVKKKNNKALTEKTRIPVSGELESLDEASAAFVSERLPRGPHELRHILNMSFDRLTFVDEGMSTRFTLDTDLKAWNDSGTVDYKGLVIAELKQERLSRKNFIFSYLKSKRIYPGGFSKYCMSLALLHPELKQNRFLRKKRKFKNFIQ